LPPTIAPPLGLYITELVEGCVLTKSAAVYGDTSWKLTDRLNLDAGLRWNEDEKTDRLLRSATNLFGDGGIPLLSAYMSNFEAVP
jgi:outer membrane receptor protein involved in Fe transport